MRILSSLPASPVCRTLFDGSLARWALEHTASWKRMLVFLANMYTWVVGNQPMYDHDNRYGLDQAIEMEGTCTGEHGVGVGKVKYLPGELSCTKLKE